MGDFFYGWRRKVGLLLLTINCLVLIAWVRTTMMGDQITYHHLDSADSPVHILRSMDGSIGYIRLTGCEFSDQFTWYALPAHQSFDERYTADWKVNCLLFEFGLKSLPDGIERLYFLVPYGTFVVPLTLLSTQLLLAKPPRRQRHDKPASARAA